jgi:hypothetical protein
MTSSSWHYTLQCAEQPHKHARAKVELVARHDGTIWTQPIGAQGPHSERLAFLIDEREDIGFRAEVNWMSFFNNACSSWSSACARCNA